MFLTLLLFFIVAVFCCLAIISCNYKQPNNTKPLNENWEFKSTSDSSWLPALVPGTVHTDLLANKIIDDPFYRLNEQELQWIDKLSWEYKTSFIISEEELTFQNTQLVFNGLDTYSNVYLYDRLLLVSDKMFLRYLVD